MSSVRQPKKTRVDAEDAAFLWCLVCSHLESVDSPTNGELLLSGRSVAWRLSEPWIGFEMVNCKGEEQNSGKRWRCEGICSRGPRLLSLGQMHIQVVESVAASPCHASNLGPEID